MKKLLLSAAFISATVLGANAQTFFTDDFDSYTVGNVGTDLTGATPGQGNWYTLVPAGGANSNFQFVAETGRGNVFSMESTNQAPAPTGSPGNYRLASKIGFDNAMWSSRSAGNNILRVDYEFFTGPATSSKAVHRMAVSSENRAIGGFQYEPETRTLKGLAYANPQGGSGAGLYTITLDQGGLILDANTWYSVTFFVDTTTNKAVWHVPAKAIDGSFDLVSLVGEAPAEITFIAIAGAGNAASSTVKYDNYIVSAVNTTAASVNDVISSKFNLYPNPVNDVVNISNEEHIGVNNVSVIDMNGRVVKTFEFNNQSQVQMNISDLKAGIYIFKISTNEGTASKKVVKK